MSAACPEFEELFWLLEGELSERRAQAVREHVAACSRCREALDAHRTLLARVSAPVAPSSGAAAAVMRRLDARRAPRAPAWRRWVPAGAVAAAAAAVLAVVLPRGATDSGFRPRGHAAAWAQEVGVEVWAAERPPRRLAPGSVVTPETALVASYRNLSAEPAYLLAFAVDAAGEVHWLYPAYQDAASDPAAVRLAPAASETPLGDGVIPEGLAVGPLRCVLVTSPTPLRVSDVERVPAPEREPGRLRARWPDARVDELTLTVAPAP